MREINMIHLRLAIGMSIYAGLAGALIAQSMEQPAFDVASVKPNQSSDRPTSNFPLGPGDAYTPNGGYFAATNFPLITYIAFAYKLMGEQGQALADKAPGWVTADRFDITARVEGNPGKNQMRLLMRSLLADRFKLAMHEETRQVSVAALVVIKEGKLGPQIQAHPTDSPCPNDAAPSGISSDARFPLLCGGLLQMQPTVPGRVRLGGRNVTIDFIAKSLSGGTGLGRPLVDRTGLSGTFDFNLEWTPEIRGPVKPSVEAQLDQSGPTFEQALREQLGLKLVSQKGSVSIFVLDHVEHPSEN
jgi:uncharacterized protein (TIGR03435 family)